MIAKLTGVVDGSGENSAVIDVGGVGYLVFCSGRTLAGLPASGRSVSLHIDTHVREDHIHLYGFGDTAERDWFRLLTTVQGVGARVALAILTALPASGLAEVIVAADKAALCQANGVGAKLAGRILGELQDKIGKLVADPTAPVPLGAGGGVTDGAQADAVSALVNLGYRRAQAFGVVASAARRLGAGTPVEELIRSGLSDLGAAGEA
ncbi:MAG: Holliday junction branch migration protein RuvA [Proteobacteria bacterium]|nr:Holliday junction branch migration protein RuvA [Pseudomonadota bacterium]